jgi:hypothetical protein
MGVISTQGIKFQLVAKDTILDLFKDEEILLSDNVTGLFDLGIVPADFTRQINLPGSKKNNAFFEHVYDISVYSPDTFATNIKVPCYIDFQGIYLAQGYLQLNKVNVIANKFIDSYEVTIYGAVSSFAREVQRNFLTDMTSSLAQYNHTASYDNIVKSWNGELFSGSIVYPFADYGQKLIYSPDTQFTGIDSPEGGMCVQDYKPAIRIRAVWDAIFNEYGYTYSGSFWQQSWLDTIYMVCNNQLKYPVFEEVNLETYGLVKIGPVSGSTNSKMTESTPLLLPWNNILSNPGGNMNSDLVYGTQYPTRVRGDINLNFNITRTAAVNNVPQFTLIAKDYNTSVTTATASLSDINTYMQSIRTYDVSQGNKTGTKSYEIPQSFAMGMLPSGSYQFYLQYTNYPTPGGTVGYDVYLDPSGSLKSYVDIQKANNVGEGMVMNIGANMPFGTRGIKQIEFITAIQKKFNLVIYPSKTVRNEFVVESFNNWYNKGVQWDFNKYINLDKKLEVIPANNFAVNELSFGDLLDNDYVSQQFSKAANREFGKTYYVDQENFFSQGKFDVKPSVSSSPLVYLQGTGVSGSAQSGGPVATLVGVCNVTYNVGKTGWYNICTDYQAPTQYDIYSSTGILEPGAVLYYDEYGNSLVTGYIYIRSIDNCDVYTMDRYGTIIYYTGTCQDLTNQPCV